MLQTAVRPQPALSETPRTLALYSHGAPVGEQMRAGMNALSTSLDKLELMLERAPARGGASAQDEALQAENQALKSKCARLEQENARLSADQASLEALLGEQEEKNATVSRQVLDLSVKLETLLARLGKVLEE